MHEGTPGPKPVTAKPKRPAVVIMCVAIFALLSIQGVLAAIHGLVDMYIVIQLALIIASLLCLLVRARSQITYYVTSAALVAIVLKALDSAVRFRGHVPPLPPDSPFNYIGGYVVALSFCLLLWRYTFGRPSRKFYGFSTKRA
jgi:hypothetical protein